MYRLVEKSVLLINSGSGSYGRYFTATSSAREFLGFFQHGARYVSRNELYIGIYGE